MGLSDKHNQEITRYLRDIARELRDLNQSDRRAALQRANARIMEEVASIKDRDPDDDDIKRILQACGSPESFARYLRRDYPTQEKLPEKSDASDASKGDVPPPPKTKPRIADVKPWGLVPDEGKLLGVCASLSRQLELDARFVRLIFIVFLITGPIAMFAYIGLYFFMYSRSDLEEEYRVDYGKLIQAAIVFGGVTIAVHLIFGWIVVGITWAFEHPTVNGQISALEHRWTWILEERPGLIVWAILFTMPFAIAAALPVHKAWSKTLNKLAQCAIAVYAVYLTYGVSYLLTGIGIEKAGDFQGIDIARLLSDYLY